MISKIYTTEDNRPKTLTDEFSQIAIDFDGVIHKCSKGFHDGTIYDDPVEGSLESVRKLAEKYTIVVYSAKARGDRPLVNGKTGIELIWEWLKEYGFSEYVQEVTAEKPRAICYIDDRAVKFDDWKETIEILKDKKVL